MANLIDYLEEYRSCSFDDVPFTEADNLALSLLAYCDFSQVVPGLSQARVGIAAGGGISLRRAWEAYSRADGRRASHDGPLVPTEVLLRAMAESARFGEVRLVGFEQRFDLDVHEQFTAYTALLPDGSSYVAFRGTGSHICGWRENFMMSYQVVAAQDDARCYLEEVAVLTRGPLRVGGHSKGGNLAAFAAAFCAGSVRLRVREVWCNDSPGFVREVVDFSALHDIAGRIRLFVPQFCIVAGIMEQVTSPVVVRADAWRYLQHDAMTWQIENGRLVRGGMLVPECHAVGEIIDRLIYSRTRQSRVEVTDEFFDALSLAGIVTVRDFARSDLRCMRRLAGQLRRCSDKTRTAVGEVIKPLVREEVARAAALAVKALSAPIRMAGACALAVGAVSLAVRRFSRLVGACRYR